MEQRYKCFRGAYYLHFVGSQKRVSGIKKTNIIWEGEERQYE
jgi:hypothetical protein